MIPDTDGTGQERKERHEKTRYFFCPCNPRIEAEAKHYIHEDRAEHDDDSNLRDRQNDLVAPMIHENNISTEWHLAITVLGFIDSELILEKPATLR